MLGSSVPFMAGSSVEGKHEADVTLSPDGDDDTLRGEKNNCGK